MDNKVGIHDQGIAHRFLSSVIRNRTTNTIFRDTVKRNPKIDRDGGIQTC
ncbi:MAG: hypothetical protein PVG35_00950 [Desulfobacterales bacterium]